jgi:hypothetical protein
MVMHHDLFPSANPQRDLAKARSRAVAARREANMIRSGIGTGDDRSRHERLLQLNAIIAGSEREMAAMRKQLGQRKRTDEDRAESLRNIRGEKPVDKGPVYLDRPARKSTSTRRTAPNYVTRAIGHPGCV